MKKSLISLSAITALFLSTCVFASEIKIGIIDMHKIFQNASAVKASRERVKKQFESRRNKLLSLEKSIKTDMAKLERDGTVMSETEKTEIQNKVIKDKRNLERLTQDFRQDLALSQRTEMASFQTKVQKAIDQVAKKGKYDLILQKGAASFSNKRADVTDQVLEILG